MRCKMTDKKLERGEKREKKRKGREETGEEREKKRQERGKEREKMGVLEQTDLSKKFHEFS